MENPVPDLRRLLTEIQNGLSAQVIDCFYARLAAIESIEVDILDRLDGLSHKDDLESRLFRESAFDLVAKLESLNDKLFDHFRTEIRMGTLRGEVFRMWIHEHIGSLEPQKAGYDILDQFLNGLFSVESIPESTREAEPEMVYYQKTPGRVVLELLDHACFTTGDVFYDLGSGLGQVPLLVHLLSGVPAKGVEYEPAYVRYSEQSASDLGVSGVTFVNADVRDADLSDGTVFFLYTPFTGKILEQVLEKLRGEAQRRPLRVFTYGPCTLEVSKADWLVSENPGAPDPFKLGAFRSR